MMNLWKGTVRRVGATLLACVLLLGLLPQLPRQAGAAYTDPYLQQMVDGGFMRGYIGEPPTGQPHFAGRVCDGDQPGAGL